MDFTPNLKRNEVAELHSGRFYLVTASARCFRINEADNYQQTKVTVLPAYLDKEGGLRHFNMPHSAHPATTRFQDLFAITNLFDVTFHELGEAELAAAARGTKEGDVLLAKAAAAFGHQAKSDAGKTWSLHDLKMGHMKEYIRSQELEA